MGNIREEYKVELDEEKKKKNKNRYDVAAYPFGAEEMLLNAELEELEKKQEIDRDER